MKKDFVNGIVVALLAFLPISLSWASEQYKLIEVKAPFKMQPIKVFVYPNKDFKITAYGAKAGGSIDNTQAIAAAIRACHQAGGGRVVVPAGVWLTGPIHFKSNVNLYLEEHAVLSFTDRPESYLPAVMTSWEGMECYNYSPLLYAFECENVAISGKGTLQPQMDSWKVWFKRPQPHLEALKELYTKASTDVPVVERQMAVGENHLRPHLIHFNRCKNVQLDGFKIRESPFWTIHLYLCDGGIVRNLDVKAHGHNNDGIDFEMSRNFLVEHCTFDQGDDAVVIKAGRNQDAWRLNTPCENIVIRHCRILNGHTLLGIGSEMSGGIRNIYMHHCEAPQSVMRLFFLKTNLRRGGFIENVYLEDVKAGKAQRLLEIDTDVLYQWKDLVPTYEERITRINGVFMNRVACDSVDAVYELKGDAKLPINRVEVKNINVGEIKRFIRKTAHAENVKEENINYRSYRQESVFELQKGSPIAISYQSEVEDRATTNALQLLLGDMENVFYVKPTVSAATYGDLIIGTVGKSALIEALVAQGKLQVGELKGKAEAFVLSVVRVNDKPTLVVAGSDRRGTAYGLLEVSRLIGVSPWEWWADVPPAHKETFTLPEGYRNVQSPSVPYRGIFINDEDFAFMPWSYQTFEPSAQKGRIGPKTYEKVFQLLLRLRANTIWPAMHESTIPFFLVEGNKEMAHNYAIMVGGSHCEPMMRSTAGEWPIDGVGEYDYVNNQAQVHHFWEKRVAEVAHMDNVYTLGMRGVHDGKMQGAKTVAEQKEALTRIFKDQRQLLQQYVGTDLTQIPQVFIPYKEVLDVYHAGLDVPQDVALMWTDDNYGYIRHFPDAKEQARPGGNGVYYHISYWGRPHDYLWLGTASPALLYQQMKLAYEKGIRQMWVLNVGDIKPGEYQTELFLDMAWDFDQVTHMGVDQHLKQWLQMQFGAKLGEQLYPVMQEHYRLAYIRKPEFMGNTREEEKQDPLSRVVKDLPWSEQELRDRLQSYAALAAQEKRIEQLVPQDLQSAYFQLVKYPVQGAVEMNNKLVIAQLARHGKADWEASDEAFDRIVALTAEYNALNNGKWNLMMNYRPRQLPVFNRVKREVATTPLSVYKAPLSQFNGADYVASTATPTALESLGYQGKAIAIAQGHSVSYQLDNLSGDSITIEVRLLPNHPISGSKLRFTISLDDADGQVVEYQTYGRTEEWKQNVLRNQAIRSITLPIKKSNPLLRIKALDEGVVVDQILVY